MGLVGVRGRHFSEWNGDNIPLIRSLVNTIQELIGPIESIRSQIHMEVGGVIPTGLDLLMGELTMVVLIFADVDRSISELEIDILNDFRRAIYGSETFAFTGHDYLELCRKYLSIHPKSPLSIDFTPYSVQYLQTYDRENGTEYADKAKDMFFRLATAIVKVDGTETSLEKMILLNFNDILYL